MQPAPLSEMVNASPWPTWAQSCGLAARLDDGSRKTSAAANAASRIIDPSTRARRGPDCSGKVLLEPVRAQPERAQLVRPAGEAVSLVLEDLVLDVSAKSS